jgi:Asp-tRNA(Asn)/Glu-tRNA(Gln) amidotransferase A subunit family amidase
MMEAWMSTSSLAREPLAQLARDLAAWTDVLRGRGLRRRGEGPDDPEREVRASDELERFRDPAKAIIIWLELCAHDADAAEVDDAMARLRDAARRVDMRGLESVLDEHADEHLSSLDLLIQAASKTASRLEDLDAHIPSDVWQGFGDA